MCPAGKRGVSATQKGRPAIILSINPPTMLGCAVRQSSYCTAFARRGQWIGYLLSRVASVGPESRAASRADRARDGGVAGSACLALAGIRSRSTIAYSASGRRHTGAVARRVVLRIPGAELLAIAVAFVEWMIPRSGACLTAHATAYFRLQGFDP